MKVEIVTPILVTLAYSSGVASQGASQRLQAGGYCVVCHSGLRGGRSASQRWKTRGKRGGKPAPGSDAGIGTPGSLDLGTRSGRSGSLRRSCLDEADRGPARKRV